VNEMAMHVCEGIVHMLEEWKLAQELRRTTCT